MMKSALRYLLDTDTCIYLLNGESKVKNRVAQVGIESLAVASITKGELYFGAYNSIQVENNLERIRVFFNTPAPKILPLDEKVMEIFGRLKATLRRKGQPIGDIDLLIAGVAISNNLTLVTNNTKHFERIPNLSLENWYETHSQ
jgi:tRNA(fMet)-specific endonuclease VapC